MGLSLEYNNGQTPIDEDEKEGLKIKSISTRQELDEFEQQNIEKAIEWSLKIKLSAEELFSEFFIRKLHKKMFGDTWKWAGQLRLSEKNIGSDPVKIGICLKKLNDDALYWIQNHSYSDEEIAIRYKHEIVKIHCFANGNGRHSRLIADLIISKIFKKPVFTWGRATSNNMEIVREKYLWSLRKADNGDVSSLISFANS